MDFCENAKAWLDTDESNVVSLHCKAGKGRAGIMAACLMVRMGQTADAAVHEFDAVGIVLYWDGIYSTWDVLRQLGAPMPRIIGAWLVSLINEPESTAAWETVHALPTMRLT